MPHASRLPAHLHTCPHWCACATTDVDIVYLIDMLLSTASPYVQMSYLHYQGFALCAGVAGRFSAQQLSTLEGCLPPGAVLSCEADRAVQRAEGQQTDWLSDEPDVVTADSAGVDSAAGRRLLHARLRRAGWRQAFRAAARLFPRRSLRGSASGSPLMWVEDAAGPTGAEECAVVQRSAEHNCLPLSTVISVHSNNPQCTNLHEHPKVCVQPAVNVEAPVSEPLPLPIVLPPLTVAAPGQRYAPTGLKVQLEFRRSITPTESWIAVAALCVHAPAG